VKHVKRRPPHPRPILDDCQECGGTGECQVHCEVCGVALTEANLAKRAESYVCTTCDERGRLHDETRRTRPQ
jgi:RecJ-like exonuclease